MKKGQELALSTIIIAVLVLLVLLVLGIILTKQTGNFSAGVNSCEQKAGTCQTTAEFKDCMIPLPQYKCTDAAKPNCCLIK